MKIANGIMLVISGALLCAVGFWTQASERTVKLDIGRYQLAGAGQGVGIYRLDTMTGEIRWCVPTGTLESGYLLKCADENVLLRTNK